MSTPESRARQVRGALVGACSAAVTVGAHGVGGGAVPQGAALLSAVLACAVVGAALAGLRIESRRGRLAGVAGALVAAQALGHLMLAVAGGAHQHGAHLGPTPAMVAAHLGAAALLAVAITSVEYLYLVCTSVLCWLRLFTMPAPPAAGRPVRMEANDVAAQSVPLCPGLGMRAPPQRRMLTA